MGVCTPNLKSVTLAVVKLFFFFFSDNAHSSELSNVVHGLNMQSMLHVQQHGLHVELFAFNAQIL